MQKFRKIFEISLQNRFEYRLNSFLWMIYSFIPILTSMALWNTVYTQNRNIAGFYSRNEMMTYYFIMMIVTNLLQVGYDYHGVANDIKTGGINTYLVRPYDFMTYKFIYSLSENVLFVVIGTIPIAVIWFLFRDMISVDVNGKDWVFFLLAIIIGYIIHFESLFIMSICAFFMNSITSLYMTLNILKSIVSGQLFPLSILPNYFFIVLKYSPFQYIAYYPVCILQKRYSYKEMIYFTVFGCIWAVILFVLSRVVWKKGLTKYSAFGG